MRTIALCLLVSLAAMLIVGVWLPIRTTRSQSTINYVTDGTVLDLDANVTTMAVQNTGAAGGQQSVACPGGVGHTCHFRFYQSDTYRDKVGGSVACHDPCIAQMETQLGQVFGIMQVDSGTEGQFYLNFTQPASVSAPFTIPRHLHGFKGVQENLSFS